MEVKPVPLNVRTYMRDVPKGYKSFILTWGIWDATRVRTTTALERISCVSTLLTATIRPYRLRCFDEWTATKGVRTEVRV